MKKRMKKHDLVRMKAYEEAMKRLADRPGLFDQLTPEQKAAALAYDGPEILGDAEEFKRR